MKQQDNAMFMDGVINPQTGAEKKAQLEQIGADLFEISEVAVLDPAEPGKDFEFQG